MMIDTWFGDHDTHSLGFLHLPDDGKVTGGVVLCPPLGYDHVLSYRAMRFVAQELAARGLAALRFDYMGEGDSVGESGVEGAPERWMASIARAVEYLRESGIPHVALLGLGVGALLANEAAHAVDATALALWDPELSGRRWLRRQRSLYEFTVGGRGSGDTNALLYLTLHPDAAAWLSAREITPATLPVGIDSLVVGRRARADHTATLELTGSLPARVEYRSVTGQEELLEVTPGSDAVIPEETITGIVEWLAERLAGESLSPTPVVTDRAVVGLSLDGVPIVERLRRIGPHRLFAIETSLEGDSESGVVVLQPGGAEHRVGPGRFQVLTARDLAARGRRAIRFDRRVTGDTTEVRPGEPTLIFADEWVDDTDQLIAELASTDIVAHVGLCAGGWVAGRLAGRRPARLTVLLSPNYFKISPPRAGARTGIARVMSAARLNFFHDLAASLEASARMPDSTLALLFTPEDTEDFAARRGPNAVARLRDGGADIRVTDYPFGDHSLFGEEVRTAMLSDLMALVEEAIPRSAAVTVGSPA
jgi:alpha-beta hydrolase superfamily lysophospholipase